MKYLLPAIILASSLLFGTGSAAAQSEGLSTSITSINPCIALTYNLKLASRDSETKGQVSDLQRFLQAKGYLSIEPTGYFGFQTKTAVKQYQNATGITPTSGLVGPATRKKINQTNCETGSVATSTIGIPEKPKPSDCPKGTYYSSVTGKPCKDNNAPNIEGCSTGNVFSSLTGRKCPETVSTRELPNITMVRSMAAGDFEIDSESKVEVQGSNLDSKGSDTKVYIGGIRAAVTQFGEKFMFVVSPLLIKGNTYDFYVVTSAGKSNVVRVKVIGVNGVVPGCSSGMNFSTTTGQTCPSTTTTTPYILSINPSQNIQVGTTLEINFSNGGEAGSIMLKTSDGTKTWGAAYKDDSSYVVHGFKYYDGSKLTINIPETIGRGQLVESTVYEAPVPVVPGVYNLYVLRINGEVSNIVPIYIR